MGTIKPYCGVSGIGHKRTFNIFQVHFSLEKIKVLYTIILEPSL